MVIKGLVMSNDSDPLKKSKEQFSHILERISNSESAVGIDAQLTHAIIIDYLKQITARLKKIEEKI